MVTADASEPTSAPLRPVVGGASVSTVKAYHLVLNKLGWATFYVDDLHGTLSIVSDYGNWAHRWGRGSHLCDSGNLSDFLVREDKCHYLADKLMSREERREYSPELTRKAMLAAIVAHRWEGLLSREEARRAWEGVLDISFSSVPDIVLRDIRSAPDLDLFQDDPCECICYEPSVAYLLLRDQLLPLFLEQLRNQSSTRLTEAQHGNQT